MNDLDIGDDAGAAGLAFSFGSDGQPYFVAMIAEGRSLVGLLAAVASNAYTQDLDNQAAGNYVYDNNGNLIADPSQNLGMIYWTVYGKMAQIYQGSAPANGGVYGSGAGLAYGYDPGGNRVTKTVTATSGTRTTTHYVRDAQGNVLAVYQYKTNSSGGLTEGDWVEQHLYGSSRLGMLQPHVTIPTGQALANDSYNSAMDATIEMTGNRLYELNNHLGNVLATVTDVMNPPGSGGNTGSAPTATIVSAQDYYPFGMEMPGRTYLASWAATPNYRYGFNGKENDNEVEGVGNSIDYGMRVYDPRAGRFMSVDPLTKKYPWYSPYQFAGNKPIWATDLDGLEEWPVNNGTGVVIGPYLNQQAAQNAVNSGVAKPGAPGATKMQAPEQPVQKKSTFSEVVGTLHTVWKIVTWDPSNPIAAQPEATTPGGQLLEMTAPYVPYEKIGGAILGKLWPEIFASTDRAAVNSIKSSVFNEENISTVTEHLKQFGDAPENTTMLKRMDDILNGKLEATEIDNNFMTHELREQELEAGGMKHQAAHEQVLKEQGMYHRDYEKKIYTQEALDAGNAKMIKDETNK